MIEQHESVGLRELYSDQATYAYNELDFPLAEKLYKQALKESERAGVKGKELASDVSNVARACHQLGKFQEAESYYQRAVHLLESVLGCRHPEVADALHDLARIKCSLGSFLEGKEIFDQVITIRTELFGDEDSRVIATRQEAASVPEVMPIQSFAPTQIESSVVVPLAGKEEFKRTDRATQYAVFASAISEMFGPEEDRLATTSAANHATVTPAVDYPRPRLALADIAEKSAEVALERKNRVASVTLTDVDSHVLSPPEIGLAPPPILEDEPEEEEQPFHDVLSFAPVQAVSSQPFNNLVVPKEATSLPRRRLPRSIVGEGECGQVDNFENYDDYAPPANYAQPGKSGIPINFSSNKDKAPSRFWQYVGIGVALQVALISLIALFSHGS